MNEIKITSKDGQTITFQQCIFSGNWKDVGGIYIFARFSLKGWQFLYIGETNSFCTRMNQHKTDKWPEAVALGAHAVFAAVILDEKYRKDLEKALIYRYDPILNKKDTPCESVPYFANLGDASNRSQPGHDVRFNLSTLGSALQTARQPSHDTLMSLGQRLKD